MDSTAQPASVSYPGKRDLKRLFSGVVLAALAAACSARAGTTPAATEAAGGLFERYEVVTGDGGRQTVLPGFFLGGASAELAVVHVDEDRRHRLRMYGLEEGAWRLVREATLGPEVLFVDLAEIGGRDRLITYEPGRLSWFDPDSARERLLVEVAASYRSTDRSVLPQVDVTRDLNGDGRDDLVIPDVDGFWVSTQLDDGSFAEVVKLGPPEPFRDESVGNLDTGEGDRSEGRTYGDVGITADTVPLYLGRVHPVDYDLDGRVDLVFWNQDHFEAHLQDESGRFDPLASSFETEVPFDSEGVYSHAFEFRDRGVLSVIFGFGEKARGTVLHGLRDLNGDGVADLVTVTLSGRSFVRQRSVYEVHFGSATPNGTVFAREAGAVIHPRGRAGGMQPWGYSSQQFEDFDGDGAVDILFRDVRTGFGGMMRALAGNSVPLDLELYRAEEGTYADQPTTRRKIRRFAPFAGPGNVFFPPVLTGDVNGDGRSDLVVGQSPKELRVFLGVAGPELLARRPETVAVDLPPDERNSRLVDLNRDGKQDLLVVHTPTARAPDRPHRLTTLIAR